ncbi:cytosolic endo-beta-N-acetylglucosaminidase isoform X4 [Leopardus geoffroyi]|uniref:cytosolic endo-beta-N-acetylglucosaminidase isoform X4 n=1 Tax=Leopardus geoffroyi TaxID=46844 RepID=UPI001E262102|nr:cytosolic endo-beta-N-acetylglucosaminidase isoform X4 [Leopardus geoffroyi]
METAGPRTRAAARLGAHATREEQRKRRPVRRWQRRRIGEEQEEAVFREVVSFTRDPLPARYYDKDTTKPISFYLPSLEELLAWTPDAEDSFNVALEPLKCRQPPLSSQRPRTLLCHDMMGGYLDDKFIQGSAAQNPYCFYHWQCIDIFVYFSHHLVTIPPVGWTNAAHRHGVCVLGTFIAEWKEGGRLCEAFLAGDERSYQAVADQLVLIAQFFRFDGWLINIESSLSLAAVGNVPPFLRYLSTQLCRQVPGGLVLWYDSVVSSGQVKWQNELNEQNRIFFDSCHGFFTNYNWREEHLDRMVAQAGERRADVYVGVDVFARGNVVGGQFDTHKSLELIRKHGFSAALFAPGWVYECLEKRDFFQNQDKFWGLLGRYLPPHSICSLPFVTSFCLGMGTRRVCYGQEEAVGPWYHPSAQEIQPLFAEHRPEGDGQGWVKTHCCLADAWNGGSSLLIRGVIPPEVGHVAVSRSELQAQPPPPPGAPHQAGQMGGPLRPAAQRGLGPALLRGEPSGLRPAGPLGQLLAASRQPGAGGLCLPPGRAPGGGCQQPAQPSAPGAGRQCLPGALAAGRPRGGGGGGGGGGAPGSAPAQLCSALVLPSVSRPMLPHPLLQSNRLSCGGAPGAGEARTPGPGVCQPVSRSGPGGGSRGARHGRPRGVPGGARPQGGISGAEGRVGPGGPALLRAPHVSEH